MKLATNLSQLEKSSYFIIWIGSVLYAIYRVKQISDGIPKINNHYEFADGWKILGNKRKDVSDYDWKIFHFTMFQQLLWLCIHLIISEILRQKQYYKFLPIAQIAFTLSYLFYNFNISVLVIILAQPIFFEILSRFKRRYLVWLFEAICCALLYKYKYCRDHKCIPYMNAYISYNHHTVIMLSIYWINLRCVSYTLSAIEGSLKKRGLLVLLSYCLYLPSLSMGPVIDIHNFLECYNETKVTLLKRSTICISNIFRFVFWWVFNDFLLHYIYSSYLSYFPEFVETTDAWTLYGYGYCMGQLFHLKYVVFYGLSTTLAKFENIAAPDIPKCIGRIHLYSDMWRYFDSGLHVFLKSYIYVPLKRLNYPSYLASFVSFCFVYVWHGLTKDVMVWAVLNYVGVTIEGAFRVIYNKYFRKQCEIMFNLEWRQRLACLLAVPLLALSALSNFYFFAGYNIGNLFFKRIFNSTIPCLCTLLVFLYSCCQVSTYIKKREQLSTPHLK